MTALRRRMTEDMQVLNFAPCTQFSYLYEVSRFARHFGRSPDLLGPAEIRAYCLYLIQDKHLAASSITVALSAIRCLYKVTLKRGWNFEDDIPRHRAPRKLPVVLSQQEVGQFLDAVRNLKHRVILTTCGACPRAGLRPDPWATGLRVSEAVHLKPSAIDSQRMVIRVEQGKGRKDRYVMLSPRLLELLRDYWRQTHPQVWLFPGAQPDQPVSRLTVEWACREARERSGLTKPVTPHSLRHAFAVHLLEAGADPRIKSGDKPAHHPVALGPQQSAHHGPLSAHRHHQEPAPGLDPGVRFRWKDYRRNNHHGTMTLTADEFIRRFLIHVLPDGFQRIRYYGFLGNCHRARKLALCRELLAMQPVVPAVPDPPEDYRDRHEALTGVSLRVCPHCHLGTMFVVEVIARPMVCSPVLDTS